LPRISRPGRGTGSAWLIVTGSHFPEKEALMKRLEGRQRSVRRRFPKISAGAFVSNTDQAALRNLQQLPLLPMLVRKFHEIAGDRIFHVQNSAEAIRCGPKQLLTLYQLLREACEILDVPEPELYLRQGEIPNAYTAGVQRPFMVLNSQLAERF